MLGAALGGAGRLCPQGLPLKLRPGFPLGGPGLEARPAPPGARIPGVAYSQGIAGRVAEGRRGWTKTGIPARGSGPNDPGRR